MSDRYSKLFSLAENLYAQGSPIIIKAGALLKDNESNRLLAQLKLQNISDKPVKFVKVELTLLDSVNRSIGASITFDYLDLFATRGADFGTKKPIYIAQAATRSYAVKVVEVGFDDNSIWKDNNCVWNPMPKQKHIVSSLGNYIAVKGFKSLFGKDAVWSMLDHGDLWCCTCGTINHQDEEFCYKCGTAHVKLQDIDSPTLLNECIYIVASKLADSNNPTDIEQAKKELSGISEYKDSAYIIGVCEKKLEHIRTQKKANRNKWGKLASIITSGLALLAILGYFAIYPLTAYFTGDYKTFINFYSVEKFKVPNGVTSIDQYEFYRCESLTTVSIPESVTGSIGAWAFEDCKNLTHVNIPYGVTSIEKSAFTRCTSLTNVTLPNSVTSIGSWAFNDCSNLRSIVIPSSVVSISHSVFYGCSSLTSIKYRGTEEQWNAILKDSGWDSNMGNYTITFNYTGE